MDKILVVGLLFFILTEILCVVCLFSSDWVVSDHIGDIRLGLTVLCYGAPGEDTLCTFSLPQAPWLACALLLLVSVILIGLTLCLLVVALHKRKKSFEEAARFTALGGIVFMCLVGVLFPLGFSRLDLGGRLFSTSSTFTTGYAYVLFNLAIASSIAALLATNKCFSCRYLRNRTGT